MSLTIGNDAMNDRIGELFNRGSVGYEPMNFKKRYIYLVNPPDDIQIKIKDIRGYSIKRLVAFEGTIARVDEVYRRSSFATYKCKRCNEEFRFEQDYMTETEPLCCPKDQGGCGRAASATRFEHVPEKDEATNTQIIYIEENLDSVDSQRDPEKILSFLDGSLCGSICPGNRVMITGSLSVMKRKNVPFPIYTYYLRIIGIDVLMKEFSDIEISDDDIEKIIKISKSPNIVEELSTFICPQIYGNPVLKQAILLQIIGAPRQVRKSTGEASRGDIHILMTGDPSTAKTEILDYVASLVPKGIFASGKKSTLAGLTASVQQDSITKQWYLAGGPLVMANDGGIACVDEMDKIGKAGESGMLEAMGNKQTVTIHKANIHATLSTRTPVLAAANPIYGRFDVNTPIGDQIKMSSPLLSRFDLMFIILDKANKERDIKLAGHILDYFEGDDDESIEYHMNISRELFIRYIAYAKRINPYLPPKLRNRIKRYYADIRAEYNKDCIIPIAPRHLHAMKRLSKASARVHLRDIVTDKDVDRAINLLTSCIKSHSPRGLLDMDIVETGITTSQRNTIITITKIVSELYGMSNYKKGVPKFKIIEIAVQDHGIKEGCMEAISKLISNGDIIEVSEDNVIPGR